MDRSGDGGRGKGEGMLVPARYQPPLPLDRLILKDGAPGSGDRTELDVLIVGAGPAGLAAATERKGWASTSSPAFRRRACSWMERAWLGCAPPPRGSTVRVSRCRVTSRRTIS